MKTVAILTLLTAIHAVESDGGRDPRCGGNEYQITKRCVDDVNRICEQHDFYHRFGYEDVLVPGEEPRHRDHLHEPLRREVPEADRGRADCEGLSPHLPPRVQGVLRPGEERRGRAVLAEDQQAAEPGNERKENGMPEKMTVLITKDGLARLKRYADAGDKVANDAIEAIVGVPVLIIAAIVLALA